MKTRFLAAILIAGALPAAAETAQAVLARMDKESTIFRQMTAKVKKSEYASVLNESTVESGEMWLQRSGGTLAMRSEFSHPNARAFTVEGKRGEMYYPKINTVQIYDLGKFGSLVDQFLVLGFGSSGKEILKNYTVTLTGEETVNGERTSRLLLIPKSAKVLEQIKKVQLWIPLEAGHPVQQRLDQPGGDYYLFTYSAIRLNPGLPDAAFRLTLPSNVKKEYPQK